jgi:hypothetical protein
MNRYEPGIRVVAISHADADNLYIFGYGVYEGDFLPPGTDLDHEIKEIRAWEVQELADEKSTLHHFATVTGKPVVPMTDEAIRELAIQSCSNPRIKLDNGKTVWGCECWWGDADGFLGSREKGDRNIIEIDIDEERAKHNKKEGQGCRV